MANPLEVLWSSVVGKAKIQGFNVAAESSLIEVPSVNVNLQTTSIEVQCQGYQDRPPHECFNHLRTPFLPWSWPKSEGTEQSRKAFVISQDHFTWSQRLRLFKRELDLPFRELENSQRETMSGKVLGAGKRAIKHSKLKVLLDEYPFGPSNLYSSSSLDTFAFKSDPQIVYSAHADHSGFVKLNKIVPSSSKEDLFKLCLDRENEVKAANENFSKFSRVYGFATSKARDLIGLKYWEGVSVAKLSPQDSSIASNIDLNGKSVCDVTFVDYLDSYSVIDSTGTMHLVNYETDALSSRWINAYETQVEGFEWACLSPTKSSPYFIRVGTRNAVHLFDLRSGKNRIELVRWDSAECLGGFCCSSFSPYQFYGSTSRATILLDERFTGRPILRWDHPTSREGHKIPTGCDAAFISGNGLEYVATYWGDGEVVLRAVDWNHRPCPERAAGFKEHIRLSCQIPANSRSLYEHNIYPTRADVDEVKRLLADCKRPKVVDLLTIEIRRLETRLTDLIKKQDEAKEANHEITKAPSAPAVKKAYDFQLKNYSWDQSDKFVKIYLTDLRDVQALGSENFEFTPTSTSVHFVAKNLKGRNCIFDVKELANKINPESSEYKVKSDMVVLMLKKYETEKWNHLKMSDKQSSEKPKFKPPAMDGDKDADPSASLMSMMKQMYEDGDDDMKRTIAKAWSESSNSSSVL